MKFAQLPTCELQSLPTTETSCFAIFVHNPATICRSATYSEASLVPSSSLEKNLITFNNFIATGAYRFSHFFTALPRLFDSNLVFDPVKTGLHEDTTIGKMRGLKRHWPDLTVTLVFRLLSREKQSALKTLGTYWARTDIWTLKFHANTRLQGIFTADS